MSIDFRKEVEKRKEAILKDLTEIIQINSELTTFDEKRVNAPFGEGIDEALTFMLNLGKRDGFNTLNAEHYAGHIEYGNQEEYVGMIGHLDVVPAGSGWSYPPYGAVIADGKMYGRGTEDDKGPTIAAYYAMKILKDLDLPLSKRIKLILGTDEETAWRGVKYYFNQYPEQPVAGFIPDSDFPLTYAEKGILRVVVRGKADDSVLHSFEAGLRDNMVPDQAKAVLNNVELEKKYLEFLEKRNLEGSAVVNDGKLELEINGISAHGSTPQLGVNAAYLLVHFFNEVGISNAFIDAINTYLLDDPVGKKLGVDFVEKEMGSVTINAGVFNFNQGKFEIVLNPRYPHGVDYDAFIDKISRGFESLGAQVEIGKHQKLLYVDPNSEMIQKLMGVYKKYTNDVEAKPMTTGGGTFARAMKNSVAFGPHFPGKPTYIHQKNEYIILEDFFLSIAIYAEALFELAK
ncbi:Acetylornithine deacetylase [Paracholeplasma brassicae]|uniref:Acetylornithine deacetylase n=1 Tax=Acholeplasma brassicae TaxID=61635 RepID=U4KSZ5_9MOLU|nr:dipeptidase PepV [Paracholeplasma brassicae]CCV65799.1 Acetylornithine deacetylase [Paracholeplasma brassicae]HBT59867.1 dipeptidase PepV [Acholeplasmataceae bacterium]